ncbi:MAG: hypothetical protein KAT32_01735 [Candidatus Moranbacteria bacterium]|nr:hypothetical protein [Candidatus Moranbacteria bacterium]
MKTLRHAVNDTNQIAQEGNFLVAKKNTIGLDPKEKRRLDQLRHNHKDGTEEVLRAKAANYV